MLILVAYTIEVENNNKIINIMDNWIFLLIPVIFSPLSKQSIVLTCIYFKSTFNSVNMLISSIILSSSVSAITIVVLTVMIASIASDFSIANK